MARQFTGTISEGLQVETGAVSAYPFTVSLWFWPDDLTADHTVFWLGDPTVATTFHAIDFDGAIGGDPARAFSFAGTAALAVSGAAYNVSAWNHVVAIFASATSRSIILNGGTKVTDATSKTPTNLNRTCLGHRADSTPDLPCTGRLGEIAVWNTALSDADAALLFGATNPQDVSPGSLVHYWVVDGSSPEHDYKGTLDLNVTGTLTFVAGPAINPPGGATAPALSWAPKYPDIAPAPQSFAQFQKAVFWAGFTPSAPLVTPLSWAPSFPDMAARPIVAGPDTGARWSTFTPAFVPPAAPALSWSPEFVDLAPRPAPLSTSAQQAFFYVPALAKFPLPVPHAWSASFPDRAPTPAVMAIGARPMLFFVPYVAPAVAPFITPAERIADVLPENRIAKA